MAAPQTGSIPIDIEARQAHVVGKAPRIEPLGRDEVDEETKAVVNRVRAAAAGSKQDALPEYMRTLLKHPAIFRCQMETGTTIFRGMIPPRDRELAILRIAWLCRAPFEWGEHVEISKLRGVSPEEIELATAGSSHAGWNDHDRAIVRGVEELLGDHALSDATWEQLAKVWNEAQMIEYVTMIGQYTTTAFIQNSLRVRLAPDNPGLSHR
jgi:alkylhydroperoxidase family enzyme